MARYSKTKKSGRLSRKYNNKKYNNKMTSGGDKKGTTKSKSPSLRNRAANPLQRNDMPVEGNRINIFDILREQEKPRLIRNSPIIINENANNLAERRVTLNRTKRSQGKLNAFIDDRLIKDK